MVSSSISVSTQPAPITAIALPASINAPATAAYPPAKVRSRRLNRIITVLIDILVFIWIGLIAVLMAVLCVAGFVAMVGLSLASIASIGVIAMLTGNGILRAAHFAHYTSNAFAAYIGAVGCLISSLILGVLTSCIPKTYDEEGKGAYPWYIQLCIYMLICTLSGTIGSAILLHNHIDLGGIDVLHATRAAALGGAIFGPGVTFILPLAISAAMTIIFSPLWLAIQLGLQWAFIRSNETWTDRGHSYSYCYCYGTRGDDLELNTELESLPRP